MRLLRTYLLITTLLSVSGCSLVLERITKGDSEEEEDDEDDIGSRIQSGSENEYWSLGQWDLLNEADNMSYRGECDQVPKQLSQVHSRFLNQPENTAWRLIILAQCELYTNGDTAAARVYGLQAMDMNTSRWSIAASLVSNSYLYEGDLDTAAAYAYKSSERWPRFRSQEVLVYMAHIYILQGRLPLALRNLRMYLDQYPVDWYSSPASKAGAGQSYSRRRAERVHLWLRAYCHVLLGTEEHTRISTVLSDGDLQWIRAALLGTEMPHPAGRKFLESKAGQIYLAIMTDFASRGLQFKPAFPPGDEFLGTLKERVEHQVALLTAPGGWTAAVGGPLVERLRQRVPGGRGWQTAAPDSDGDGVDDTRDKCPGEPEVLNGLDDLDGCPDHAQAALVERQIVISDSVRFKVDSAELVQESLDVLRGVANIMLAYPQLKLVRVEGHTDSQGSPEYNEGLSLQRAQAVIAYLASLGVEGSRLTPKGYGEAFPIAFGENEAAWAQNRRVEFLIMEADPIRLGE